VYEGVYYPQSAHADADAFRQVLQWGADMINLEHADVLLDILADRAWDIE
jgi:hypothetical protein